jgi:hypothetical protein
MTNSIARHITPTADSSRHYRRCRGCEFQDRLDLPGWDQRSVWGYNNGVQSFFAQLWRNGSRAGKPRVSLSGQWPNYRWPGCLALDIIAATEQTPVAVVTALAVLDPSPRLRPADEIEARVRTPPGAGGKFTESYRRALLWVLGKSDTCPGSKTTWTAGIPEPRRVDVEHELLAGRVYSQAIDEILNQVVSGGGESALWWALCRGDDF